MDNISIYDLLKRVDELIKEIEELERKIKIKDEWCKMIYMIGCDYDGYNDVENLKKIIDELVNYANNARSNDDTSVVYEGTDGKTNILDEPIGEINE